MKLLNIVLLLIALVVIGVYVSYYYCYPPEVSVVQTSLENFSFQIFMEKQPIVVQDKIQDISEVRKAWFGANITFNDVLKNNELNGAPDWVRNRYKFLVLQPTEDTEIVLYPPHLKMIDGAPDPDEHLLAMRIRALQTLILPIHWRYHIAKNSAVKSIGVHDFVTPFLP